MKKEQHVKKIMVQDILSRKVSYRVASGDTDDGPKRTIPGEAYYPCSFYFGFQKDRGAKMKAREDLIN